MSQYDYEDEEFDGAEDEGQDNLPAPARKRLRDLEKLTKKQAQDIAERDKRLSDYQVRDVLNERGLTDQRAVRWLKADGVDLADTSAVDAWLNENGDVFNYKPPAPPEQSTEAQEGQERMAAAEERGVPVTRQAEILAEFNAAQTDEELAALKQKYSNIKIRG